jgi:hypothetical protein
MDYWQNLDHMADMASVYGMSQRQSIISAQRQAAAEQGRMADLQSRQLEVERERLDAEERQRQEQRDKAEKQKSARKLFCVLEQQFKVLEQHFNGKPEEVLNLALVEEHLKALERIDVFESLEDIRALSALSEQFAAFVARAISSGRIEASPSAIVKSHTSVVNDILAKAFKLFESRLVLHPRYMPSLLKEKREFDAAAKDFDARMAAWKREDAQNREGLAEVGFNRDTVSKLQINSWFASQPTMRAANRFVSLMTEWGQIGERLERLRKIASGLDDRRLELYRKFTVLSDISQLHEKRRPLISTANCEVFDNAEVSEKLDEVREMMTTLDNELEALQESVPRFCLEPTTGMLNRALVPFARIVASGSGDKALEYVADPDMYDFLYQHGSAYDGLKAELGDIEVFLREVLDEYQQQCAVLNGINETLSNGNVFSAEKELKSLPRKFRLDYAGFDKAVEQVKQPYVKAEQVLEDAQKYAKLKKNIVGQLFARNTKAQEIQGWIQVLRNDAAQLPECELQAGVLKLVAAAENALKG